ncbi:hypothetical protein K7H99_20045 [Providencia rettgeri]|uniref:hypothetical protein n=1 Tax=Providencia rettgeri TaxID=587 RepID=UPI001CA6910B|nr:hypothetical protein [Providencia rettgeri]QZY64441.1 hypothetical protein K7H99_20045 [Providencia rettgeri]
MKRIAFLFLSILILAPLSPLANTTYTVNQLQTMISNGKTPETNTPQLDPNSRIKRPFKECQKSLLNALEMVKNFTPAFIDTDDVENKKFSIKIWNPNILFIVECANDESSLYWARYK